MLYSETESDLFTLTFSNVLGFLNHLRNPSVKFLVSRNQTAIAKLQLQPPFLSKLTKSYCSIRRIVLLGRPDLDYAGTPTSFAILTSAVRSQAFSEKLWDSVALGIVGGGRAV